jgi:hypothetical protein
MKVKYRTIYIKPGEILKIIHNNSGSVLELAVDELNEKLVGHYRYSGNGLCYVYNNEYQMDKLKTRNIKVG